MRAGKEQKESWGSGLVLEEGAASAPTQLLKAFIAPLRTLLEGIRDGRRHTES